MKYLIVLSALLLTLTGCSKTWQGVKQDSNEAWDATKKGTSKAYESTKKAVHEATSD